MILLRMVYNSYRSLLDGAHVKQTILIFVLILILIIISILNPLTASCDFNRSFCTLQAVSPQSLIRDSHGISSYPHYKPCTIHNTQNTVSSEYHISAGNIDTQYTVPSEYQTSAENLVQYTIHSAFRISDICRKYRFSPGATVWWSRTHKDL